MKRYMQEDSWGNYPQERTAGFVLAWRSHAMVLPVLRQVHHWRSLRGWLDWMESTSAELDVGTGDQGIMSWYVGDESEDPMPLTHSRAHV